MVVGSRNWGPFIARIGGFWGLVFRIWALGSRHLTAVRVGLWWI